MTLPNNFHLVLILLHSLQAVLKALRGHGLIDSHFTTQQNPHPIPPQPSHLHHLPLPIPPQLHKGRNQSHHHLMIPLNQRIDVQTLLMLHFETVQLLQLRPNFPQLLACALLPRNSQQSLKYTPHLSCIPFKSSTSNFPQILYYFFLLVLLLLLQVLFVRMGAFICSHFLLNIIYIMFLYIFLFTS